MSQALKIAELRSVIREALETLSEDASATMLITQLRTASDALDAAKRIVRRMGSGQQLYQKLDAIMDDVADISIGMHHLAGNVGAKLESARKGRTNEALDKYRDGPTLRPTGPGYPVAKHAKCGGNVYKMKDKLYCAGCQGPPDRTKGGLRYL